MRPKVSLADLVVALRDEHLFSGQDLEPLENWRGSRPSDQSAWRSAWIGDRLSMAASCAFVAAERAVNEREIARASAEVIALLQ